MNQDLVLYVPGQSDYGNQIEITYADVANKMNDEKVIQRAKELMRYQKYRPYMVNDKLHILTTILLRSILIFRPNENILTFDMLVIGLDTCASELYFGLPENDNQTQSDLTKISSLKYSIVAQLLTAAVLPTERMPISWNRRSQTIDVKGLINSCPSKMLDFD